jgi:iron complex transport system substrate-binding protein
MKKLMGLILSAALLTGLLAGCAGTPANETDTSTPPVSNTGQNKESAWPRTIKDAAGYEVILKAKPERVTMLHTYPLEFFLALDVKPTATARVNLLGEFAPLSESELYSPYLSDLDMMDLGSALEINLEAVLESNPDVIVTFAGHRGVDAIHDQLVAVAPVIYIDYTATWQDQLAFCAEIFGKEDEVAGIVADIEGAIADANKTLEKYPERTLAFFRTDGKGFIALGGAAYYNTFKITKPDGFPAETISLEAVADMDPYYIVFQHNYESSVAFVESMESSSVWNSLDAVKNGRIYYFDEEMNTFGPLTMRLAAEKLTQLYTE